ncbi:MAG: integrin alpha [Planctomycetota bacterium]|nr:integrin alpha [Planctomycetota bacterium]MDA0933532.1 integrin alpha [Planctomycetota bacterium]
MNSKCLWAATWTATLTSALTAQSLILTVPGEPLPGASAVGAFGIGISRLGDLDGDGHDDLLIGSPSDARAPAPAIGSVRIVSGRTGLVLTLWTSPSPTVGSRFGASVAGVGDVNGDGAPDFLVGEPDWNQGQGRALLVSGRGPILASLPGQLIPDGLGGTVEATGDLDGDGVVDFLVTNQDPTRPRPPLRWRAFSGANLSVLHDQRSTRAKQVVGGGDVDGDAYADLLVADITASPGGTDVGTVQVLSGQNLRVVASVTGTALYDYYGQQVRGVGDVNGDGRDDFAAFGWVSGLRVHGLSPGVRQYGPSFTPAYAPDHLAPIGDIDADGHDDFAVGVESGGQQLDFVSGATIQSVWTERNWNALGFAAHVQLVGDIDADGVADVAVAAPYGERSGQAPAVFVYSVRDRTLVGDAFRIPLSTGGIQTLTLDFGTTSAGQTFVMLGALSGVVPGTQIGTLHLPLNADPYTLSMLGGVSLTLPQVGTLDAFGRATSRFALPPGLPSGLAGWTFHHAALTLDPSGVADVSQAVPVTTIR